VLGLGQLLKTQIINKTTNQTKNQTIKQIIKVASTQYFFHSLNLLIKQIMKQNNSVCNITYIGFEINELRQRNSSFILERKKKTSGKRMIYLKWFF